MQSNKDFRERLWNWLSTGSHQRRRQRRRSARLAVECLENRQMMNGDFGFAAGFESAGGYAVAADAAGNVYTTGYFEGTVDFDPGPQKYYLTSSNGSEDIFVSKLDSSGNFVWAQKLGGNEGNDYGRGIAVAPSGNVYTIGLFWHYAYFNGGSLTTGPLEGNSSSHDWGALVSMLQQGP